MFAASSIIRTATAGLLLASVTGAAATAAETELVSSAGASLPPAVECRTATTVSPDEPSWSPDPSSLPKAVVPTIAPCASVEPTSTEDVGVELTVQAGDLWFGPDELTISSQGTTTITLVDVGAAVHNLTVDELDVQVVAAPSRSSQVSIIAPEPGTYQFYCSVSGHRAAGMVGTLIVE